MSDWQPIETAPRDGALLLLYSKSRIDRHYCSPEAANHFCIGYYAGDYHDCWLTVETREEMWGMGGEYTGPMYETDSLGCDPTHWMPLPNPPGSQE